MKIAGIIAEYNPFHNGHAYLIEKLRDPNGCAATHVVAVMSGNFVQRGEPAICPKSYRVKAALANGVDAVIELPTPWAMSSAQGFAWGAVSLLHAAGCVDVLGFGSESGNTAALMQAAETMSTPAYAEQLRNYMGLGLPYNEAQRRTMAQIGGERPARLLENPNDMLAIEYIRALLACGSAIQPYAVQRFGVAHDQTAPLGTIASASYIRQVIAGGRLTNALPYLPAESAKQLATAVQAGHAPSSVALVERAVLAKLRTMSAADWAALPGVSEGLENRMEQATRGAKSLEELATAAGTKRYPPARISRLIWSAFLGIPAGWERKTPPYLRVLGFSERGEELLTRFKHGTLPLISRCSQIARLGGEAAEIFAVEQRATDLYALTLPSPFSCGTECTDGILSPD